MLGATRIGKLLYFILLGNMAPYMISYMWYIGGDKTVHHSLTGWLIAGTLAVQGLALPLSGILVLKIGSRPIILFSIICYR